MEMAGPQSWSKVISIFLDLLRKCLSNLTFMDVFTGIFVSLNQGRSKYILFPTFLSIKYIDS